MTESGTTFQNVTFEQFYASAASFFQNTHDRTALSLESAQNGNKALGLLYMGGTDWTEHDTNRGVVLLELATKRECEVALAHAMID